MTLETQANLEFEELNAFRRDLLVKRNLQPSALAWFRDEATNGFRSSQDRPSGRLSPSSTSTCVSSLIAASQWDEGVWAGRGPELAKRLLVDSPTTQGLEQGNIYTESFVYEAALALIWESATAARTIRPGFADLLDMPDVAARMDGLKQRLLSSISRGSVSINDYPPSAYLTQLVVRVLMAADPAITESREFATVKDWAWIELYKQVAMISAGLKTADSFHLAYAVILISALDEPRQAAPDKRRLIDTAIDQVFAAQLDDGSWPRSAPIFDLPGTGNTYCYEYEMLAQLLLERHLEERLVRYLPALQKAYNALIETAYELPSGALAWASGHRPQVFSPESWATASAYHFIYGLERLVSEAIRRAVFRYLRASYIRPASELVAGRPFAQGLLDAHTHIGQDEASLREILFSSFVEPIARLSYRLESGLSLPSAIPTTAIFFGPPGTSKTELSKAIADYLQWPRITLDPSDFVRNGMDMISAEADRLFSMLEALDRVVVLLDEIDELVRERSGSSEILSRFLTTSMLPKLASIRRAKRIVFLVATNHIEQFDVAISRPGRFDLILQVMPPSLLNKYAHWPILEEKLSEWLQEDETKTQQLGLLTYDETSRLADRIQGMTTNAAIRELDHEFHLSTLNTPVDRLGDPNRTWSVVCQEQQAHNRVPLMRRRTGSKSGLTNPRGSE
jgi:ATPase family protein associated with various cellular activities (AAA)